MIREFVILVSFVIGTGGVFCIKIQTNKLNNCFILAPLYGVQLLCNTSAYLLRIVSDF